MGAACALARQVLRVPVGNWAVQPEEVAIH